MKTAKAVVACLAAIFCFGTFMLCGENQNISAERTLPQSKAAIEKALRTLQSSVSGRLPVLDGFAQPGDLSFDRFQRAFYQCVVQITPLNAGGAKVKVKAKITAWYADPNGSHSGYQTLLSNGRLETDLLDQISDALGVPTGDNEKASAPDSFPKKSPASEPAISAPMPRLPEDGMKRSPGSSLNVDSSASLKSRTDAAEKNEQRLSAEAKGLEEILQNQSHPTNLAAVKKTGTSVLQSPNADAEILFPATAGDEFEILDINSNWVHVRISGISRGWIRRASLEMPEDNSPGKTGKATPDSAGEFKVSNEQVAPFPGDWEPLRGKIVQIITVQKAGSPTGNPGAQARLKFAKSLFLKNSSQMAATDAPAGIVIIFDSDDGGMIAATTSTLKGWQEGSSSDDQIWRQCFFDPPELIKN